MSILNVIDVKDMLALSSFHVSVQYQNFYADKNIKFSGLPTSLMPHKGLSCTVWLMVEEKLPCKVVQFPPAPRTNQQCLIDFYIRM